MAIAKSLLLMICLYDKNNGMGTLMKWHSVPRISPKRHVYLFLKRNFLKVKKINYFVQIWSVTVYNLKR